MKSIVLLFTLWSASAVWAGEAKSVTSLSLKNWTDELRSLAQKGEDRQLEKKLDREELESALFNPKKSADREALKKGRRLFAAGKFPEAIAEYNKISAGSPQWLEALEEKGWAALRQGDFEKALAETKTLLSPHLRGVVGSEPFLLQSLSQLKACDYEASLKTHQLFKESQRARLLALQNLADTAKSPDAEAMLARIDSFPLALDETGANAAMLPRQFERDIAFQKAAFKLKTADAAIAVLRESESPVAGKAIPRLEREATAARAAAMKRLQALARAESDENFSVLQKLNLIEVDTIQRVHTDQELARRKGAAKFAKTSDDELMFMDDGNPWIDELDHYQVKMNTCDQNLRRKM